VKPKTQDIPFEHMTDSELHAEYSIWKLRLDNRAPSAASFAQDIFNDICAEAARRGIKVVP
jgi:hypothetical protein